MTSRDEYLATLADLAPDHVATYLTGSGWREQDRTGRSTIWEYPGDDQAEHRRQGDQHEVLIPRVRDVRDYVARMVELLQILSTVEDRPKADILRDLTTTDVDRQYFRTYPETPPGTIPVTEGLEAVLGVRDLLIAGAFAVVEEPVLILPSRRSKRVQDFPKQVRLGPSSEGSYILSTQLALPDADGTLFPEAAPFGRRVFLRLYDAVRSAQVAAEEAVETSDLAPFTDRVGEGISITLCRGLARLSGQDRERPFEIRFSWANTSPPGIPTTPIRFTEPQITMLAQAEEDLGGQSEREAAVLTGLIWRTEIPGRDRRVVVRGMADTATARRRRHVWVQLDPDDFTRALDAHDRRVPVRLEGTLARSGNRTELQDLRGFTILEATGDQ